MRCHSENKIIPKISGNTVELTEYNCVVIVSKHGPFDHYPSLYMCMVLTYMYCIYSAAEVLTKNVQPLRMQKGYILLMNLNLL